MSERDFLERYSGFLNTRLESLAFSQKQDLGLAAEAIALGQYPKNRLDMQRRSQEINYLLRVIDRTNEQLRERSRWDPPARHSTLTPEQMADIMITAISETNA